MNFKKALGYAMVTIFCLGLIGGIASTIGIVDAIRLVGGAFLAGAFLATGVALICDN